MTPGCPFFLLLLFQLVTLRKIGNAIVLRLNPGNFINHTAVNEERKMKEFVAYIVKNLVDHPDKVKINEIGGTQTLIIELSVEKTDIGKIIGKKGKTINAIRTLLMSVASRNGIRVNLEILEEGEGPPENQGNNEE